MIGWKSAAVACGVIAAALIMALRPAPVPPAPEAAVSVASNRIELTPAQSHEAASTGLAPAGAKSLLKVDHRLKYGEFVWDASGAPAGELRIQVDLKSQLISVFRGGHEIGTSVILYGADSHATPSGTFPILAKLRDHHSRTYDAPMPFTLRLTDDGVAIHGSSVRAGRATHGCVGVPEEFARRLFDEAKVGDRVQIVTV